MTNRQDSRPHSEFKGRARDVLLRLQELHPKLIDLSLGRLEALLARLNHPERHLPPVIHVAGTNGKGSTCASLRAIAEHAGLRTHVMTSPHLLDVTERFRLAGTLVSEDQLIETLEEIERLNQGEPITVFEVLTAAGLLLFSRIPADLAIIEVGLGGRFDATNVITAPRACIITSVSLDHQAFLGNDIASIAREKAGIIKQDVPVIVAPQEPEALQAISSVAQQHEAPFFLLDRDITADVKNGHLHYHDDQGSLTLPEPALKGKHQVQNTALAIAALRHSDLALPDTAYNGIANTFWPARLQRLHGSLASLLPQGWELILDGGHNPGAGDALAHTMAQWKDRPLHIVVGLKDSKDASGFLRPLLPYVKTIQAVAEPDQHLAMPVEKIQEAARQAGGDAIIGPTVHDALTRLTQHHNQDNKPARVLICGSLYLAGCALARDGVTLT
ncbi:bifunctional folylpolyglutamate synthase/dihydrofolate synthase [Saccharibacter sp. 17.LH.SD]|uniref:bifunctional folylpolyglutamate synthase/dihydrofolate synthase n=1 Tax=Saccharibacter sp. 17.LH.SD TaxID=2689393 RepID=UPI00136C0B6F|nr:folylpolyglutamate synthase/dihydrofolate synthase family protein [Saccharibacter sp. 17.LH.SD]MXV45013.1 bifunctional folylpolyglutamate synthase/dihydrofolate synthase [Saccharibacter sp. 17.LH.SD]